MLTLCGVFYNIAHPSFSHPQLEQERLEARLAREREAEREMLERRQRQFEEKAAAEERLRQEQEKEEEEERERERLLKESEKGQVEAAEDPSKEQAASTPAAAASHFQGGQAQEASLANNSSPLPPVANNSHSKSRSVSPEQRGRSLSHSPAGKPR